MPFYGQKVKLARLYRNISVSELASNINVSRQAVSQFENGDITPKSETIFKLVSILNFPIKFFTEDVSENIEVKNTFLFDIAKKINDKIRFSNITQNS